MRTSSRAPKTGITQTLQKYGYNKLFKASNCYLVGDTNVLFFLFVFHLEKSLGFVFKKILITQTQRKPTKSHKQKQ